MSTLVRVMCALFVGALDLLTGLARVVFAFAGPGRREEDVEDDPLGQGVLFGDDPGVTGAGYTAYGREPVVAGRNGEPVGAYSGLPIAHY